VDTPVRILIVGGGPAGTFAAIAARRRNPAADVLLLTDEPCEPYEKPPLSKGVLLGKVRPADAPIAGPGGVAAHGVTLTPHARVRTVERESRTVVLANGERLSYHALVLATGSLVRELPQLPAGMPRVHYLRNEADAQVLLATLQRSRRLLVVGAGLIGLEVAASAARLGLHTTVLELAPRILARVCDEHIGAIVEAAHRRHGVDVRLGVAVAAAEVGVDGGARVTTTDGEQLEADLIVVGTGATPNDRLARSIGLATDEGIVVDAQCRTSDPAIFAAGDAVRFPGPRGPVRLENWRHAQDQGSVAGANAAGGSETYATVPSFWSEQYDLYIQGVGWPEPGTECVRRPVPANAALSLELRDGRIVSALGINVQRDLAAVRRLIERRVPVERAALADPAQPLAALLKR
jgi:3-phenylpropionate/trans-cinnamate dioxygenase ferredoxin reductase component